MPLPPRSHRRSGAAGSALGGFFGASLMVLALLLAPGLRGITPELAPQRVAAVAAAGTCTAAHTPTGANGYLTLVGGTSAPAGNTGTGTTTKISGIRTTSIVLGFYYTSMTPAVGAGGSGWGTTCAQYFKYHGFAINGIGGWGLLTSNVSYTAAGANYVPPEPIHAHNATTVVSGTTKNLLLTFDAEGIYTAADVTLGVGACLTNYGAAVLGSSMSASGDLGADCEQENSFTPTTAAPFTVDLTAPSFTSTVNVGSYTNSPSISWDFVDGAWITDLTTASFTAADFAFTNITSAGKTYSCSTDTCTMTASIAAEGSATIDATGSVSDAAGFSGALNDTFTTIYDITRPTVAWVNTDLNKTAGTVTVLPAVVGSLTYAPTYRVTDPFPASGVNAGVSSSASYRGTVTRYKAPYLAGSCGTYASDGTQTFTYGVSGNQLTSTGQSTVLAGGKCYYWSLTTAPKDLATNAAITTTGSQLISATIATPDLTPPTATITVTESAADLIASPSTATTAAVLLNNGQSSSAMTITVNASDDVALTNSFTCPALPGFTLGTQTGSASGTTGSWSCPYTGTGVSGSITNNATGSFSGITDAAGNALTTTPSLTLRQYAASTPSLFYFASNAQSFTASGSANATGQAVATYSMVSSGPFSACATAAAVTTCTFTVPAGVTSISAVVVGAGGGGKATTAGGAGGGAGALTYGTIAVTPGQTLTVKVGGGGVSGTTATGTAGAASQILNGATNLLLANGGAGASSTVTATTAGGTFTVGAGVTASGGSNGGAGGAGGTSVGGGGGGAGGYSAAGGAGGTGVTTGLVGNASTGGGGGGGGAGGSADGGGGGGGVGLLGAGTNGTAGTAGGTARGTGGGAGSSGVAGGTPAAGVAGGSGGLYGGGAGGADSTTAPIPSGGNGGIRIIWGPDRAYPSTLTADQTVAPATTMAWDGSTAADGGATGSITTVITPSATGSSTSTWTWTGTFASLGVPGGAAINSITLSAKSKVTGAVAASGTTIDKWEYVGTATSTIYAGRAVTAVDAAFVSTGDQQLALSSEGKTASDTFSLRITDIVAPATTGSTSTTVTHDTVSVSIGYVADTTAPVVTIAIAESATSLIADPVATDGASGTLYSNGTSSGTTTITVKATDTGALAAFTCPAIPGFGTATLGGTSGNWTCAYTGTGAAAAITAGTVNFSVSDTATPANTGAAVLTVALDADTPEMNTSTPADPSGTGIVRSLVDTTLFTLRGTSPYVPSASYLSIAYEITDVRGIASASCPTVSAGLAVAAGYPTFSPALPTTIAVPLTTMTCRYVGTGLDPAAISVGTPTIADNAGNSSTAYGAGFTVAIDAVRPTISWTAPATNAYRTTSNYTPVWSVAGATSAGVVARVKATMSAVNTCPATNTFTTDVTPVSSNVIGTGLLSGSCYAYTFTTVPTDAVGNAADTNLTSAVLKVDTVSPASLSVVATGASAYQSAANGTVWFRPGTLGTITLTATATDTATGLASIAFGPLADATGWTGTPSLTAVDTTSPYTQTLDWDGTAVATTLTVSATDVAGTAPSTVDLDVTPDATAPTISWGASIATDGGTNTGTVTPSWTIADTESGGTNSGTLILQRSVLSGNSCSGSYTDVATQAVASSTGTGSVTVTGTAATLVTGYCYRWTFDPANSGSASEPLDQVGNGAEANLTSGVLSVDTTAPTPGSATLTESSSFLHASGTTLFYSSNASGAAFTVSLTPTDGQTGIASVSFPAITGLGTAPFNGPSTDTTSPYSFTYAFGTRPLTASGAQTLTATDRATNTATTTVTLTDDATGPAFTTVISESAATLYAATATSLFVGTAPLATSFTVTATLNTETGSGVASVTCPDVTGFGSSSSTSGSFAASGSSSPYSCTYVRNADALPADGAVTETILAPDNVGNAATGNTFSVRYDQTAPTIASFTPSESAAGIHATGTTVYYRADGGSLAAQTFTITANTPSDGSGAGIATYTYPTLSGWSAPTGTTAAVYTGTATPGSSSGDQTVTITDLVGNARSYTTAFTMAADTAAPTVTLTAIDEYNGTTLTAITVGDVPNLNVNGSSVWTKAATATDKVSSFRLTFTITDPTGGAGFAANFLGATTAANACPATQTGFTLTHSNVATNINDVVTSFPTTATSAGSSVTLYCFYQSTTTATGAATNALTAVAGKSYADQVGIANTATTAYSYGTEATSPTVSSVTITESAAAIHSIGSALYVDSTVPANQSVTLSWTVADATASTGAGLEAVTCPAITGGQLVATAPVASTSPTVAATSSSSASVANSSTLSCTYTGTGTNSTTTPAITAGSVSDAVSSTATAFGLASNGVFTVALDQTGPALTPTFTESSSLLRAGTSTIYVGDVAADAAVSFTLSIAVVEAGSLLATNPSCPAVDGFSTSALATGSASPYSCTYARDATTLPAEGAVVKTIVAPDNVGNAATASDPGQSATFTVNYDRTGPAVGSATIALAESAAGIYANTTSKVVFYRADASAITGQAFTVTVGAVTDAAAGILNYSYPSISNWTPTGSSTVGTYTATATAAGSGDYAITVTDNVGNTSTISAAFSMTADTAAPTITTIDIVEFSGTTALSVADVANVNVNGTTVWAKAATAPGAGTSSFRVRYEFSDAAGGSGFISGLLSASATYCPATQTGFTLTSSTVAGSNAAASVPAADTAAGSTVTMYCFYTGTATASAAAAAAATVAARTIVDNVGIASSAPTAYSYGTEATSPTVGAVTISESAAAIHSIGSALYLAPTVPSNQSVTLSWTVADATASTGAGLEAVTCPAITGGQLVATAPTASTSPAVAATSGSSATVVNSTTVSCTYTGTGVNNTTPPAITAGSATDAVSNTAAAFGLATNGVFTVALDQTGPALTPTLTESSSLLYGFGGSVIYVGDIAASVSVSFTLTIAVVEAGSLLAANPSCPAVDGFSTSALATGSASPYSCSYTRDATALPAQGAVVKTIVAPDNVGNAATNAGNTGAATFTVNYDRTGPNVSSTVAALNGLGTGVYYNSTTREFFYRADGTAPSGQIGGAVIGATETGGSGLLSYAPTTTPPGWTTTINTNAITYTATAAAAGSGDYTITITDNVGNTSTVPAFTLIPDSAAPTISLVDIVEFSGSTTVTVADVANVNINGTTVWAKSATAPGLATSSFRAHYTLADTAGGAGFTANRLGSAATYCPAAPTGFTLTSSTLASSNATASVPAVATAGGVSVDMYCYYTGSATLTGAALAPATVSAKTITDNVGIASNTPTAFSYGTEATSPTVSSVTISESAAAIHSIGSALYVDSTVPVGQSVALSWTVADATASTGAGLETVTCPTISGGQLQTSAPTPVLVPNVAATNSSVGTVVNSTTVTCTYVGTGVDNTTPPAITAGSATDAVSNTAAAYGLATNGVFTVALDQTGPALTPTFTESSSLLTTSGSTIYVGDIAASASVSFTLNIAVVEAGSLLAANPSCPDITGFTVSGSLAVGASSPYSCSYARNGLSLPTEGAVVKTIVAPDNVGNAAAGATFTVNYDRTAPTITSGPTLGASSPNNKIFISGTDVRVAGTVAATESFSAAYVTSADTSGIGAFTCPAAPSGFAVPSSNFAVTLPGVAATVTCTYTGNGQSTDSVTPTPGSVTDGTGNSSAGSIAAGFTMTPDTTGPTVALTAIEEWTGTAVGNTTNVNVIGAAFISSGYPTAFTKALTAPSTTSGFRLTFSVTDPTGGGGLLADALTTAACPALPNSTTAFTVTMSQSATASTAVSTPAAVVAAGTAATVYCYYVGTATAAGGTAGVTAAAAMTARNFPDRFGNTTATPRVDFGTDGSSPSVTLSSVTAEYTSDGSPIAPATGYLYARNTTGWHATLAVPASQRLRATYSISDAGGLSALSCPTLAATTLGVAATGTLRIDGNAVTVAATSSGSATVYGANGSLTVTCDYAGANVVSAGQPTVTAGAATDGTANTAGVVTAYTLYREANGVTINGVAASGTTTVSSAGVAILSEQLRSSGIWGDGSAANLSVTGSIIYTLGNVTTDERILAIYPFNDPNANNGSGFDSTAQLLCPTAPAGFTSAKLGVYTSTALTTAASFPILGSATANGYLACTYTGTNGTVATGAPTAGSAYDNILPPTTFTGFTVANDTTGPTVTWAAPLLTAGYNTAGSATLDWTLADAGAGVAGNGTAIRQRAVLSANTCGSYVDDETQTKAALTTLSSGYCYRVTFDSSLAASAVAPTDALANPATTNLTSAVIKVDTTAPVVSWTAPSVAAFNTTGSVLGSWSFSDPETGVANTPVVARYNAGLAGNACAAYTIADAAAISGAAATIVSGNCAYYAFTTAPVNAASLTTSTNLTSAVVKVDTAAPVLAFTTPAAAATQATTAITPAWTTTDAVTGVATAATVIRQYATLSGNSCGSYVDDAIQSSGIAATLVTGRCYRWTADPLLDVSLTAVAPVDLAGNTTSSSLTSAVIKVDTSAPSQPGVTVSGTGFYQAAANGVVYFKSGTTGTIALTATSADGESGLASLTFSALSVATGWTATPTLPNADTTSPYTESLAWGATGVSTSLTVTPVNNAALTGTARTVTITADGTGPALTLSTAVTSGTKISLVSGTLYVGAATASDTFTLTITATEAGSGLAAPACPAVSGFSVPTTSTLTNGASPWTFTCLYTGSGSGYATNNSVTVAAPDNVGNVATGTTAFDVKADTNAPGVSASAPTTTGAGIYYPGTGSTIYYAARPTAGGSSAVGQAIATFTSADANFTACSTTGLVRSCTFTVPAGVNLISASAIGGGGSGSASTSSGGGGGGGALVYGNSIAVSVGDLITVEVGGGGPASQTSSGVAGGTTRILKNGSPILVATGGSGSRLLAGASGGTFSGSALTGGGTGGAGGSGSGTTTAGGGGGAGGYGTASGTGGLGGSGGTNNGDGTAGGVQGAGGGAGGAGSADGAGGGGGSSLYGSNGADGGTAGAGSSSGSLGAGGGGVGNAATGAGGGSASGSLAGGAGGTYGGGGGGADNALGSGAGGSGAVRIVWGSGRAFPATNVATDLSSVTGNPSIKINYTVTESATDDSGLTSVTCPATFSGFTLATTGAGTSAPGGSAVRTCTYSGDLTNNTASGTIASTTNPGTATDAVTRTSSVNFGYARVQDVTAPSMSFTTPSAAGYATSTAITPSWSTNETGSGVATAATVVRQRATSVSGSCTGATYTNDTTNATSVTAASATAVTLLDGYCYRWTADSSLASGAVKPVDNLDNVLANGDSGLTSGAILVDATAPSVASFTSAVSSPTNSTSIAYTLTFSESVSGIAAGDFENAGTATGCTFTPSASSGTTITVTATTCSTSGTLQPRLLAPATTWRQRTSSFSGSTTINDITYGNGLYVAVGTGGTLATSPDGTTWTQRTSSFDTTTINAITYGNGLYVAVGQSGKLATSPDGTTWTQRTSSFGTTYINDVTYGNGLFVAVGQSGGLATSPDGTTWTQRTSSINGASAINGVSFGNGLYVAVGQNGELSTSADGTTWTPRWSTSSFGTTGIDDVTYGNSLFVAVGQSGKLATSPDGTTWTQRTSSFGTTAINAITYGNSQFVAGGQSGKLATSGDGVTDTADNTGPAANTNATTALTLDRVAPTVSSFTSAVSSPTNATSIDYTLTFSESVSGIAAGDFENAGTATGCTFTPSAASGSSITLTVTTCSTTGTLSPRLLAAGVTDTVGNTGPAANANATTTLTLDRVAPTVSSFTSAVSSPTNSTSIDYTLTFSESVSEIAAADFSNAGTATGCTFTPSAASGTTITVTVTTCSTAGTLQPRLLANGVADTVGNTGPAADSDATTTLTLDRVAPTISWSAPSAGTSSQTSNSFLLEYGVSDANAGAGPTTLQRERAAVSVPGSCAGVAWSDNGALVDVSADPTGRSSGTLLSGYCYRWTLNAADAAGNTASSTSGMVIVDTTPASLDVTASGSGVAQAASNGVVYFNPAASGTISLAASATDEESGVASVTFGDLSSATGWTPTPSLPNGDVAAPYSQSLAFGTGAVSSSLAVTATNGVGTDTTLTLTLTRDATGPAVTFTAPTAFSYQSGTAISVSWTESDAGAGVASRSVQRYKGTIVTTGSCAGVSYTADGAATTTGSPRTDSNLAAGYCYRYVVTATDGVGNEGTATSAGTIIDETAPSTPSASVTNGDGYLSGSTLYFRSGQTGSLTLVATATDAESDVASIAFAGAPGSGVSATPTLPSRDNSAPYSQSLSWNGGTASGGSLTITARNGADGDSSPLSLTLTADNSAPSISSFDRTSQDLVLADLSGYSIQWTASDAGSGLAAYSTVGYTAAAPAGGVGCSAVTTWSSFSSASYVSGSAASGSIDIDGGAFAAAAIAGNCYYWSITLTDRVGNTSSTDSPYLLYDTTAPSAPSVTASGDGIYQSAANAVIFFRPQVNGSLALTATADDAESGIRQILASCAGYDASGSSEDPAANCPTTGWSGTFATVGIIDESAPFVFSYDFGASAASTTIVMFSYNGAGEGGGGATATALVLTADSTAPTANFSTPNEGSTVAITDGTATIDWAETESGSGVASRSLQRQRAAIDGTDCPASGWSNDGTPTTGAAPLEASGLLSGYCYRYVLTLTDHVGNSDSSTSGALLVDSSAPDAPSFSVTGSHVAKSGNTVYYGTGSGTITLTAAATDSGSGIAHITFGPLSSATGFTPGATLPYDDTTSPYSLAIGFGAAAGSSSLSVTATNGAATTSNATTLSFVADRTPPSAAISLPAAGLTPQSTTTVSVAWSSSDAGSGLDTITLQREKALIPLAGSCADATWAADGVAASVTATGSATLTALDAAACYRWTLTATDAVGNETTTNSGSVLIDTTAPSAPSVSASGSGIYQAAGSTTVYFKAGIASSLVLTATATDDESGVASITFAYSAGATTTGWTPDPALPHTASSAPYSTTLAYSNSAGSSSVAISARNAAGLDSETATTITLTADSTAPTVTISAPTAYSASTSGAITLSWSESDSGSGVATRSVQRYTAAIPAAGDCSTATYVADGAPTTSGSSRTDTGLASGACYRYGITATDRVGTTNSETFSAATMMDTTAPDAPTLTIAADSAAKLYVNPTTGTIYFAAASSGTLTVTATGADNQSGVASISFAALTGSSNWSPTGAATIENNPAEKQYSWSANASGITLAALATNGAGADGSTASLTLTADSAAPSISWTSPEAATTNPSADATDLVFSISDSGSGIASTVLQRQRAATTLGACPGAGSFTNDGGLASIGSSPISVTGLATGYCYRWIITAADRVGQQASATSGTIRIDTTYSLNGVPQTIAYDAGKPGDLVSSSSFTAVANAAGPYSLTLSVSEMNRRGGSPVTGDVIAKSAFRFVINGTTYYAGSTGIITLSKNSGSTPTGQSAGDEYVVIPKLSIPFVSTGTYDGTFTFIIDGIGQ